MNKETYYLKDGVLYHAGVKGMQWGKHLPGTDWWKESLNKYYKQNKVASSGKKVDGTPYYGYNPTFTQRVKANFNVAGQAAKIYGNKARAAVASAKVGVKQFGKNVSNRIGYGAHQVSRVAKKFWNDPKKFTSEQVSKLSELAKSAYSEARKNVVNFFTIDSEEFNTGFENRNNDRLSFDSKTPLSHLDVFQNKQLDDACRAYVHGKASGDFSDRLNYWFQNAQYGIVKGVNSFLKNIGMDDEVDDFISKFKGNSTYKNQRKRLSSGNRSSSRAGSNNMNYKY